MQKCVICRQETGREANWGACGIGTGTGMRHLDAGNFGAFPSRLRIVHVGVVAIEMRNVDRKGVKTT